MVSFWPWSKTDSSPALFEKTLSALSVKIAHTQGQLDKARATSRRIKVLSTLYLGFAYLVYAIVEMLVVGWRNMGPLEWTGLAAGPLVIYLVRTVTTTFFEYRIETLNSRLKDQQNERAKTIQKLKDATKYDSTLELLEKYGGPENKSKKNKKKTDGEESSGGDKKGSALGKQAGMPNRTIMPPPPTANIQRIPPPGPSTPQPRSHGAVSPPPQRLPQPDVTPSAEFAPNAFDGKGPPPYMRYPPTTMATKEAHWYDRILDTLLGEDETAAKNRIVLICGRCRLVNGQAPPGTKSLSEVGAWKCMACGVVNGEMDEGKRIVQEVLEEQAENKSLVTDDDGGSSSSSGDLVEVEQDEVVSEHSESAERGSGKGRAPN
ncbi:hypothetical protein B0T22DRAFT_526999 [Podospora appendiculata]|uniref:Endoplasmic reticulum junction formation protein lunapark n=1 Tax=Podospora appendiculata TaxID=314037 RepID=A0AAE1CIU4_9PEZI|nr:hypothetical protein B0T22DRAFT_526999 [Podospora appendiculata]